MPLLLPDFMEEHSTSESSGSLKSNKSNKIAEYTPRSSIVSLVPSIFSHRSSTKSDKTPDSSSDKSPIQSARSSAQLARTAGNHTKEIQKSSTESDILGNSTEVLKSEPSPLQKDCPTHTEADDKQCMKIKASDGYVTALVSHFEQLGSMTDARNVADSSSAPPIEQALERTFKASKKHVPNIRLNNRSRPRPQPTSYIGREVRTPNLHQPRKSFSHRFSKFLCISANPDDNDYSAPPLAQASSTLSQRLTDRRKRAHHKDTVLQTHANGARNVYVPRYTSKGHAMSTSTGMNGKKGRDSSSVGAPATDRTNSRHRRSVDDLLEGTGAGRVPGSLARDISSSPIALPTASSRRLNPKLHRAHIGAVNDKWMQQYLPQNTQKDVQAYSSSKYRSCRSALNPMATKSSLTKDSRNSTLAKSASAGHVASTGKAFSTDLPLVKQVIEEEGEDVDEEAKQSYKTNMSPRSHTRGAPGRKR